MYDAMTEQERGLELKRQLDWELSLDSRELVSHGWYHGPLERAAAEALLPYDGSFLVRDSTTQPGHYVLSCRQGPHFLHFVINRVVIQPDTVYEHFQYQFEHEAYDTVPDLVTSYVGSGKPISNASGARITTPSNRNSAILCCQTGAINHWANNAAPSSCMPNTIWNYSLYCSNSGQIVSHNSSDSLNLSNPCRATSSCSSPNVNYPVETNSLNNTLRKTNSLCSPFNMKQMSSALNEEMQISRACSSKNCLCSPVELHANRAAGETINVSSNWKVTDSYSATKSTSFCEPNSLFNNPYNAYAPQCESAEANYNYRKQRSHSLSPGELLQMSYQKSSSADGIIQGANSKKLHTIKSESYKDDLKIESWETGSQGSPPAKPARTQPPAYQASGSDSGNGSGDSAQSSAPGDTPQSGEIPRNASKPTMRRPDIAYAEEMLMQAYTLEFKEVSVINTENFRSALFSSMDNKPLESDTLQAIKLLLRTSGPMILANHLMRVDLKFILSPNTAGKNCNPLEKISGLELCLLAHGHQMRLDILERAECMKFFIVVTILTCQTDAERADVLNDWIQLAIETKTALGNLFGFSIIMMGLCTKQVECMENMWNILRQKHTYSAFTFEAKLRPCFKTMNDCADSPPPNTTLPHLLPIVTLFHSSGNPSRHQQETVVHFKLGGVFGNVLPGHSRAPSPPPYKICPSQYCFAGTGVPHKCSVTCPRSSGFTNCSNNMLPEEIEKLWDAFGAHTSDFGLSVIAAHLEAARRFPEQLSVYDRNARAALAATPAPVDEDLLDLFRTEFHIKFLWGARGALSPAFERHSKLADILTTMAERYLNPVGKLISVDQSFQFPKTNVYYSISQLSFGGYNFGSFDRPSLFKIGLVQ